MSVCLRSQSVGRVALQGARAQRLRGFNIELRVHTAEMCLKEAVEGQELVSLQFIEDTHRRLAKEVGLDASCLKEVLQAIHDLADILQGVGMIGEVSPRLHARICSYGERMSTLLAVQILKHAGIHAGMFMSGDLITTSMPLNANDTDKYLNANVFPRSDPAWAEAVLEEKCGVTDVVVTQGFVAKNQKVSFVQALFVFGGMYARCHAG